MIIGHPGRETKEKFVVAFGVPAPEGCRKALRLMEMARTLQHADYHLHRHPGAYHRRGRGRAWSVWKPSPATCVDVSRLNVPVICTVIEGAAPAYVAIGVGDKVNMLQYSTYSVISPEGCASILWKSADNKAPWLLKQWASSRRV